MDLLTNPLKSGKAEMESPPTKVNTNAQGIFLYSPPKLGESAFAGHVENGSRSHEQKTLVQNVGECMSAGSVDRHCRSQSDCRDHITHLADDVIGKKLSGIIFKNRIDNPVDGHDDTQRDEDFHSGKTPGRARIRLFWW